MFKQNLFFKDEGRIQSLKEKRADSGPGHRVNKKRNQKGNRKKHLKGDLKLNGDHYKFTFDGDIAKGVLPDGTSFLIDKESVDIVSQYRFRLNWKGYPQATKRKNKGHNLMLHWIVLGFTEPPDLMVDHINRDKTDCRKANLRIVTNQQNCMNRGIGRRNKTGYLGTFYNRHRNYYMAKICINNHQIYLLRSASLERCAQAYNYASKLLFRDFAGYRNQVSEADLELKKLVFEKCRPYLQEAMIATRKIITERR